MSPTCRRRLVLAFFVAMWVGTATLDFLQRSLIYHPPPSHHDDDNQLLASDFERMTYATDRGLQTAIYVPPLAKSDAPDDAAGDVVEHAPRRIWLLFHGNAGSATDWTEFIRAFRRSPHHRAGAEAAAFLAIEYPGYGGSAGSPSPRSIRASIDAAVRQLLTRFAVADDAVSPAIRLGVIAHSLGCGAALTWAAHAPIEWRIDRFLLMSPFTSIRDMATRVLGLDLPGLRHVLSHEYDNAHAIRTVFERRVAHRNAHCARSTPAATGGGGGVVALQHPWAVSITVYHGARDEVVPVEMGRALAKIGREYADESLEFAASRARSTSDNDDAAAAAAESVPLAVEFRYEEVPFAGHNEIASAVTAQLWAAMGAEFASRVDVRP